MKGGRVRGLNTDSRPPDVPLGTIFEQTNTTRDFFNDGTAGSAGWAMRGDFLREVSYVIFKDAADSKIKAFSGDSRNLDPALSSATANTTIQAAIDAVSTDYAGDVNRDKGTIIIRNNNFYTGLDLTLKSGVILRGEGEGTWLTGKITVQDTSDNSGMYNIRLYNAAADHCLYVNGARSFRAVDCVFELNNTTLTKFPVLVDGGTAFGALNTFERCKIVSKGHGFKQMASASTHYTNTTMLRDCWIGYNAGGVASGGQIGVNVDGDGVEKNFQMHNCYVESWDTSIVLDEGNCHLQNIWLDTCTTAGITVSKAAVDNENIFIDVGTASITTQPLLVIDGRKFYVTSPHYSLVYDTRRVNPETSWIQKYIMRHAEFVPYSLYFGHNATTTGEGVFATTTLSGTAGNSGNYSQGQWCRYTGAGASGDNSGFRYTGTPYTYAGWGPAYFAKFRVFDKTNTRGWFGLFSVSTEPAGDDWLTAADGFGIGWKDGQANFQEVNNNAAGATVYTDTGIAFASNTIYTVEIRSEPGTTPRWGYSINEATMTFQTAELPTPSTTLFPHFNIEETAATTARLLDRFMVYIRIKTN